MNVYFISGLAADRRVFRHIQLPEGFEKVYLDWIPPFPGESLPDYAFRLSEPINPHQPFILVGLSMGGMIASEIARRLKPEVLVLISSVPVSRHLPVYFKMAAALRIHKILPVRFVKTAARLKRLFTAESNEDKVLLRQIIQESDDGFIRWAIDAILKWRNEQLPVSYIHIHGTRDEVLPLRFTRPTHVVPKAGHMLVLTNAAEVNAIFKEHLGNIRLGIY